MKAAGFPQDELFELERKIARRADELARQRGWNPQRALEHWREAEREVWADYAAEEVPHPDDFAHSR